MKCVQCGKELSEHEAYGEAPSAIMCREHYEQTWGDPDDDDEADAALWAMAYGELEARDQRNADDCPVCAEALERFGKLPNYCATCGTER